MEVELHSAEDAGGFIRCRTRNIGFGGMFVATGPVDFMKFRRIDVRFCIPGRPGRRFRVPSWAVQRIASGICVKFLKLEKDALRALQELLYQARPEPLRQESLEPPKARPRLSVATESSRSRASFQPDQGVDPLPKRSTI